MVKSLLRWPELTESNLRRHMKNAAECFLDHDNDIKDDLNGLTAWEEAFLRGVEEANDEVSNEA